MSLWCFSYKHPDHCPYQCSNLVFTADLQAETLQVCGLHSICDHIQKQYAHKIPQSSCPYSCSICISGSITYNGSTLQYNFPSTSADCAVTTLSGLPDPLPTCEQFRTGAMFQTISVHATCGSYSTSFQISGNGVTILCNGTSSTVARAQFNSAPAALPVTLGIGGAAQTLATNWVRASPALGISTCGTNGSTSGFKFDKVGSYQIIISGVFTSIDVNTGTIAGGILTPSFSVSNGSNSNGACYNIGPSIQLGAAGIASLDMVAFELVGLIEVTKPGTCVVLQLGATGTPAGGAISLGVELGGMVANITQISSTPLSCDSS